MADIETSVVISAQTDALQSGMEIASNSVQAATTAMRAQLAGLGAAAQQAQTQLDAATGQIGSGIGALQAKAAGLAGSIGESVAPYVGPSGTGGGASAISQGGRDRLATRSASGTEAVEDDSAARQKRL